MSFENLGLSDNVLKAVAESGYTEPTAVQSQAIPIVLQGRDLLGFAPTGTGKTAGFILPMIDILDGGRLRARMPRSLILSPTRELATQIAENFDTYGKYSNLTKALLIGGVGFEEQEKLLDRGVDVLIATPGRLLDHFGNGRIMLNDVKIFVIDEADRMLDMGFIPDIEKIAGLLPQLRQTLMFSATMPDEILRLANKFLINPKEVKVARPATAASTVEQLYVKTSGDFRAKRAVLRDVLRELNVRNSYIFCNRKKDVDVLAKSLVSHGFAAAPMHGDMDQFERNKVFDAFKEGRVSMLVCSDVAARGLDVTDVSHVINFDVPWSHEDYIHRIGRTGRAGKTGCAVMLVGGQDTKLYDAIAAQSKDALKPLQLQNPPEIEEETEEPGAGRRERHHKYKRHTKRGGRPGKRPEHRAEKPPQPRPQQHEPVRQHSDQPRPQPQPRQEQRDRNQPRGEKSPAGLGDHVPAFLLKK